MQYTTTCQSPLGELLLAADEKGLTGIWFDGGKYFAEGLDMIGPPFRLSVWKHLLEIPYGETTTYGEIAKRIAREMGIERMSAQAVGGAVGHNPVSIIVPCHRVIGADGSLTGYAGGLEKKVRLLTLEGVERISTWSKKSR